jgi:ABC-type multidrug transport system ATPase subunit
MQQPALLSAQDLGLALGGVPLWSGLNFNIAPGLTLVCGGDGRGKTSLLRVLAGQLQPTAGRLLGSPQSLHFTTAADTAWDPVVAADWLVQQRTRSSAWNEALAVQLLQALDLHPHVHKPFYMLSTGSRRKLGVLAAAASGASVTLLDTPYAALDARSRRVVDELLTEAAGDMHRAWVVADFAVPAGLAAVPLATLILLGD